MKRLIDEPANADEAHAADLLRALRDRPSPPHLEARVRARIDGAAPRRRRTMRPVGVLAALLLFALFSAASAMVLRRVIAPAPAPSSSPSPDPQRGRRKRVEPIVTPLPLPASPTPEPPPEAPPTPRLAPPVPPPPAPALTPSSDPAESQLVLDAYAALRQRKDTTLALAKIDDYLTLYPKGALLEEALTLALEASEDDAARAARYAQAYLARYPQGRQAEHARTILAPKP